MMIIKSFILPPLDNNNYLIIDEETREAALIDCSDESEDIELELKKNNATLKYILLTHGHFDHIGGVNEKHHENWDGSGYPKNLSGENIPIESQIILIVDSYCALLEDRPYRPAKSRDEALEIIMEDSNSKWSAKLAAEFSSVMKEDLV